jgi:hypothetical protein
MMKSSTQYVAGDTNTVPPVAQLQLYQLVHQLDRAHNFHSGLDLYYQLLAVLNKHFAKLP